MGLPDEEVERLDRLFVHARYSIRSGEDLYRVGDPFRALFAIRTGFFKSTVVLNDGQQRVTGFHIAGDIIGMDGIGTERRSCNAVAIEDSDICDIPFPRLAEASSDAGNFQRQIHGIMYREMARYQELIMLLRGTCAEERLAAFLLDLSRRYAARGRSPYSLYLPLTREEIGSFLGLALETVSRVFSKFKEAGLISAQWKTIRILDVQGLMKKISHGTSEKG